MEEMEAEFRVMDDLKQQIERGRINFKKSPRDRLTEGYVTARLEGLEEILKKFTLNHENIIGTYSKKVLDESSYMELDVYDTGYEIYLTYKGELKAMLNSIALVAAPSSLSQSSEPSSSNGNTTSLVKLPQISIPVFSGNYAEWLSFKDLFVSLVHNNPALDDVQRLHYLKTQLKGEAEQYIRYIPITQANYTKCWDLLQHRYNNKRFMSNCILKRLLGQRIMNFESANGIKELLDTTTECVHELLNLDVKVDTWDIIIIYIVSLKLDAETRKQWELFINNKTREELPTFSQFKEFLECRFRALEFVEPIRLKSKFIPNSFPSNTKSLHVSTDVTCPLCSDNHKLYSCSDFSKEEVSKRQDIVRSLRLCFNCLASGHSVRTCRVPTTCHTCKRRHHTLLHGPDSLYTVAVATKAPETDQEIEQPESSSMTNESNNIANHFVTGVTHNQTLLATALIRAEAKGGYPQTLRALLDQGSQASFISEAAAQLLRLDKITAKSCISGIWL